jgi:D-alanyl-D-alanine-carboxypeptidase/D-alanyl-D-alanine-endopeptidase
VLWHNGGTGGFRSFAAVAREAGTAVVVLSNTARSVDRLGLRLLKALASAAG